MTADMFLQNTPFYANLIVAIIEAMALKTCGRPRPLGTGAFLSGGTD